MDPPTETNEITPEVARAVARALGIAWVGATLYDDPLEQDAFTKAAERIATLSSDLPPITVTPRTLRVGDRDLGEEGLSIEKMAHSCFVHGIGLMRFTNEVTARSLATFLEVIQLAPDAVAHDGGLSRVLKRRLVLGVEVYAHAGAMEQADEMFGWDERWGWSAESLTAVLESTNDDNLGPLLMDGFAGANTLASVRERQAAVTAHVEALMNLRPESQAAVLGWLYERDEPAVISVFDHLATHELLRLSQHLPGAAGGRAGALLEERGASDPAWRPTTLVEVVTRAGDDLPTIPVARDWREATRTVMTGLFESDLGRDDQDKLIDVWATVLDSLLDDRSFADARAWLALAEDVGEPSFQSRVETRRHRMPSREGLAALVDGVDDDAAADVVAACFRGAPVHVLTMLSSLPPDTVPAVLDALGARLEGWEADLVDQLPGLERPLALALSILSRAGFEGGDDARLLALVNHESPDVRQGALTLVHAAVTLERLEQLVTDASEEIQLIAVAELAQRGEKAVGPLVGAALAVELPDETAVRAARALLDLPGGTKALERAAQDVSLIVSGAGRTRRRLLQQVLKGSE